MTKYLISFPASAMDVADEDMAAVGEAARAGCHSTPLTVLGRLCGASGRG